jgi:restriction endonuclease S subunit
MTSNNTIIRKYILDNCQLLKVININGGAFTNTGVKTKALIIKKCNNDNYNQDIEFIELNEEVKVLGIRKLNEKLQFTFEDKKEEIINYNSEIEIKTLGEIFDLKMGKFNSNDMDNIGDIPFYSCKSDNPCGYHSIYSFNYIEYLLLVCAGGSQNNIIGDNVGLGKCYYVNGKTACRANVCSLISKIKEINIKYIYYYLNINRLETNKKAHFTTNLGTISLNEISNLKIPIPSIEKQKEIIEYLEFNDELIKTLEKENEINKNNAELLMKQILYK